MLPSSHGAVGRRRGVGVLLLVVVHELWLLTVRRRHAARGVRGRAGGSAAHGERRKVQLLRRLPEQAAAAWCGATDVR